MAKIQGFDAFRNRELSTGAGAIREQLADLDLRIIIDFSLLEWKELGEEGPTGNEWEDRKVGRRQDFLVRRMELAKHFIRTNIEPEWMGPLRLLLSKVQVCLPILGDHLRLLQLGFFLWDRSRQLGTLSSNSVATTLSLGLIFLSGKFQSVCSIPEL